MCNFIIPCHSYSVLCSQYYARTCNLCYEMSGNVTSPGQNIQGMLIAMSHVLNTNPKMFIMEVQNSIQLYVILIKHMHQHSWQSALDIGNSYRFTLLELSFYEYENKMIQVWIASHSCECFLVRNTILPESLYLNPKLKNYKGKVTHVEPTLSMYELDNKIELCLAFMDMRSSCPRLNLGQEVTVYNAHIAAGSEHKKCFVLCGRSYLRVHSREREYQNKVMDNDVPLAITLALTKTGYNDFLRLKNSISIFQQKFSDSFLNSLGIQNPQKVRSELFVQTILELEQVQKCKSRESIVMEFLSSPHNCAILHEAHRDLKLITVEQCMHQVITCASVNTRNKTWGYKIVTQSSTESVLVGFLSVSGQTGGWVLKDASCKLDCIISGSNGTMPNVSILLRMYKVMVLLKSYSIVLEEFQIKEDNIESKIYLHFRTSDICWLQNPFTVQNKDNLNLFDDVEHEGVLNSLGETNTVLKDELMNSTVAEFIETTAHPSLSSTILLHQKSTIMRMCADSPPQCCLLVSFIEESSQQLDDATSLDSSVWPMKRYIVVIKGPLLKRVPFLLPGNKYNVILPSKCQLNQLIQRCKPSDLFNVIPHVGVIQLPRGSVIYLMSPLHSTIVPHHDWYSVSALQDIPHSEIITVEGILYDSLFITPTYNSELKNLNTVDFGVPGMKTAVLKLRDVKTAHSICLYLKNWYNHRYPLGMVHGSHICTTFVKKINSKNNYLQSTSLTNIHVLSLSKEVKNNSTNLQDQGNLLHCDLNLVTGSIMWAILCPVVLKVELNAICSCCQSLIENEHCTFIGCSTTASITTSARATCIVNGLNGKVLIHFKDDNVRVLLGIPVHIWNTLTQLVLKQSNIFYINTGKKPRHVRNVADEVFQMYCSTIPQQRRLHVQCRILKECDAEAGAFQATTRLFCLEVQEVDSDKLDQLCCALCV